MLGNIKELLRKNHYQNNDLIISVPSYWTDIERKALLDACKIAEITVPRLFNESSASNLIINIKIIIITMIMIKLTYYHD